MKIFVSLAALLISSIGVAQITVTDSDFPAPADTAMVSSSDETTLDLVTTGADAIWDFSLINISAQTIDTFHAVSNADPLYQLVFNNGWTYPDHESDYYTPLVGGGLGQLGNFGVGISAPVQFTAVLADKVQNTGLGMEIGGFAVPAASDTIDIQYVLPMNYSDGWSGNSYTNLDLNPAFDGIYRTHQQRNSIVDGWGSITTPFGTFDALRVKSLISSQDSLYIGLISSWVALPLPDQIEYTWIANGEKIPVFAVVTSDVGGTETITSIRFKDKYRTFASTEELTFDGNIYPNPAADQIQVNFNQSASLVEIYDVSGQLIYSETPSTNVLNINVQSWDAGMYILKATQAAGISTAKFVVE